MCEYGIAFNVSVSAQLLFLTMFPDAHAANKKKQDFFYGRTKATYLISDGLGKIGNDELVAMLRNQPFTLLIDECNKTYGKKYLNIIVRYFDTTQQKPA